MRCSKRRTTACRAMHAYSCKITKRPLRCTRRPSVASDNGLTAPYYLKKIGLVYEKLGDKAKALDAYKTISGSYAGSMEARDIQKYIGRLEQL